MSLDTDGLSYQVPPLSVGQPPCPSTTPFALIATTPLSGQSAPLPQGSSMVSHAGISPPLPIVVLRLLTALPSSPLCQTLGSRAEASTSTSLGSPIALPLVALPNLASLVPEPLAHPATIDSTVLATLTQQAQSFSQLAQEMQALAQAM